MREDLLNVKPLRNIPVQHLANQINAVVAEGIRHPQVAIHDLVNAVKGVLLINDGVEQDAECPDILLLAAVGLACENFRGGVIYFLWLASGERRGE